MAPTPPLPEPFWNAASPELQAGIIALVQAYEERIAGLENRLGDLQARLQLNSTNSSKPPSSDPIGMKRKPPAPPTGKTRGGQPRHRKAQRLLVPPEKVRETFDCKPSACRRCGQGLSGDDPEPVIHQVAELPQIEPIVDEYRLHRLTCPACRATTCGALPAGVPTGCFVSLSNRWFRHWHRVRDGTLEWAPFQERMSRLRREVQHALEDGSRCPCAKTAATCFEILKVEEGLWTFARVQGIEPTNNAVERALRHAVLWCRISGGTDSAEGSRFVEQLLTVVATCRQQGRNVLDYLSTCFEADCKGQALPSLLPVDTAEIEAA